MVATLYIFFTMSLSVILKCFLFIYFWIVFCATPGDARVTSGSTILWQAQRILGDTRMLTLVSPCTILSPTIILKFLTKSPINYMVRKVMKIITLISFVKGYNGYFDYPSILFKRSTIFLFLFISPYILFFSNTWSPVQR